LPQDAPVSDRYIPRQSADHPLYGPVQAIGDLGRDGRPRLSCVTFQIDLTNGD